MHTHMSATYVEELVLSLRFDCSLSSIKNISKNILFDSFFSRSSASLRSFTRPLTRKDIFYSGSIKNIPEFNQSQNLSQFRQSMMSIPRSTRRFTEVIEEEAIEEERNFFDALWGLLGFSLLKDKKMALLAISSVFGMLGFYVPFVYIIDAAVSKGIDSTMADYLLSIIGVTNIVGRLLSGYSADMPSVDSLLVTNICIALSGVFIFCVPLVNGFAGMAGCTCWPVWPCFSRFYRTNINCPRRLVWYRCTDKMFWDNLHFPWSRCHSKLGSSSYPALMVRPNVVGQNNEQGQAPIYTTFIPQVVPVSHAIQYQGQVKQQKPRLTIKDGIIVMLIGTKEEDIATEPAKKPLFMEDMSEAELAFAMDMPGGLENLGNTSYINTSVQCWKNEPELKNSIVDFTSEGFGFEPTSGVISAMKDVYSRLDKNNNAHPMLVVTQIVSAFPRFVERGEGGRFAQQDANELFLELMTVLKQKLLPIKAENQISTYLFVIDHYFGGSLLCQLKNTECEEETVKTDTEGFLQLSCYVS
ncbi:hypothetical protein QYM36_008488 [Artemia franciscana]|uniref:ubiquitinyl hydrolase 1 n=1 Tax=Artemia franciscana TaxID=6661 RepID=A0AA88IH05_ARTSF|nr:hypothetical protein QYM36_008488 [Artemia franciscana]